MNDAWGSPASEDLFRSAKHALTPSTADRDRMRARLALKIGATAAAVSIATTTSKAAASTGVAKAASIPLIAKIVAPIVIVSAVAGGVVVAPRVIEARRAHHQPPTTQTVSTPTTDTNVAPSVKTERASAAPSDETSPAVSVSINDLPNAKAPSKKTAKHEAAKVDEATPTSAAQEEAQRDEEAKLVAEIDAALRGGDTNRASRLADDHQRRFPNGLLVEEREGARVLVRCSSTPNSKLAGDFLKTHPRSPMRSRIIAACGTN